jgi:hypothetical protein
MLNFGSDIVVQLRRFDITAHNQTPKTIWMFAVNKVTLTSRRAEPASAIRASRTAIDGTDVEDHGLLPVTCPGPSTVARL